MPKNNPTLAENRNATKIVFPETRDGHLAKRATKLGPLTVE
ncbi:hypothetical protein [Candidatus Formimonas warabiya]